MQRVRAIDFAAGVLLVPPTCFWSILASLSADNPHRNIVAAVAGALAGARNADHAPPPAPDINDRDDARTGQPWAQNSGNSGRASALLVLFDSEARVLRVTSTGPGRAFLDRRVGGINYECVELVSPGSHRYLEHARTRRVDEEDGGFSERSLPNTSSV